MNSEIKQRILNICTELGEEMDSPACKKLKEHVSSCPHSAAFVDSVKKTIKLYQGYQATADNAIRERLLKKIGLK